MSAVIGDWPANVRTVSGLNLELITDEPLGQGGEGKVFRTKHGSFAVKIYNAPDVTADRVAERLDQLRWLPLERVPITRVEALLAPPIAGYVMTLLEDMVPMRELSSPPKGDLGAWYGAGGGLRRRLVLLAKCANALATLHDRGIVYSDVSPGNVLISVNREHAEVQLIDVDHLQTESTTMRPGMGTPPYIAPEVLRRRSGNTVFSDVHSFAVMAYETLTTNHPLMGDYVNNGPLEHQEDAELGLVPWIDHSSDDVNRTSSGYPGKPVLTRRLEDLFRRAFEVGLAEPRARPGAGEWADALWSAADRTVVCENCVHSYYVTRDRCEWCGHPRPPVLVIAVSEEFPRLGDSRRGVVLVDRELTLVLQAKRPLRVTARTAVRHAADPDAVLAELDWDGGDEVKVRNRGTATLRRVPQTGGAGRQLRPGGWAPEKAGAAWSLHFGLERQPHRFLSVQPQEQDRAG
jgi:DNA-binding helix-hairpin-helix protein with protein kinase domain